MTRGSSISSFFKKLSVKGSRGKTGHTSQQKEEQVEVTGSSTDQVSVPPAPVDTAKDTHSNEAPTANVQQEDELENDCKLYHNGHRNDCLISIFSQRKGKIHRVQLNLL